MENQVIDTVLVGFYHFGSKDKSNIYYVAQVLYNEVDLSNGNNKALMLNVFVEKELYEQFSKSDIGTVLRVEIRPNLSTGKVSYKVVV